MKQVTDGYSGYGGKLSLGVDGVGMFFALIGIWLDFRWDGHRV